MRGRLGFMEQKQKTKPEKKKTWKIVLIIIASFIVVSVLAASLFVYAELSKVKKYVPQATIAPQNETFENDYPVSSDEPAPVSSDEPAPVSPSAPVIDPKEVLWPSVKPIEDKSVINILLIGQDRRPGEPPQRSDSMIVLSFNPTNKTVKLISFMRDLYVQIPGYSDNRMNAAYQFGGMELLDSVIKTNFGVTIDGNLEVDFDGFAQIVDLLGGIDIEVSDYDAAWMNDSWENDNFKYNWNIKSGLNHFDGTQTLFYSRIRYVGNCDFERTERQRNVMTIIIDKILSLSTAEKAKMFDVILPYLTTDMSNQEMLSYCATALSSGITDIKKYRIPTNDTFAPAIIRGMEVLLPDLEEDQALLKEYILG